MLLGMVMAAAMVMCWLAATPPARAQYLQPGERATVEPRRKPTVRPGDERFYFARPHLPHYWRDAASHTEGAFYDGAPVELPARELADPPPLPTSRDLALMNDAQLRELLRFAARGLRQYLDITETGRTWIDYLKLKELAREFSPMPMDQDRAALSPDRQQELRNIARLFEATAAKPEYSVVSQRWGFQVLRAALPEYLRDPAERDRYHIAEAIASLESSLRTVAHGEEWRAHLELGALRRLAEGPSNQVDANEAEPLLPRAAARFQAVVNDPLYRPIVALAGFHPAHTAVQTWRHAAAKSP